MNELIWKACRCVEFTPTGATCRRNAWIQLCIQSYRGEEQRKADISAGGNNS